MDVPEDVPEDKILSSVLKGERVEMVCQISSLIVLQENLFFCNSMGQALHQPPMISPLFQHQKVLCFNKLEKKPHLTALENLLHVSLKSLPCWILYKYVLGSSTTRCSCCPMPSIDIIFPFVFINWKYVSQLYQISIVS